MKLVTWNVNSLKARAEHVAAYLDRVSPTVLCLQELKQEDAAFDRSIFLSRGYHLEVYGQKAYNGVAIASKHPMRDVTRGLFPAEDGQSRSIAATIADLRIVNLYCPQGRAVDHAYYQYKLSFYDALIAWVREGWSDALLVTGDLNIALEDQDLWDPEFWRGRCTATDEERKRFRALLDLGLVDAVKPYLAEGAFSFWDYQRRSFDLGHGLRIDHWLVTEALQKLVQGATIAIDERERERPSDHAPVELDLAWS